GTPPGWKGYGPTCGSWSCHSIRRCLSLERCIALKLFPARPPPIARGGVGMLAAASGDGGRLYHSSHSLLLAHEDKTYPGAMIASLSIPWGAKKGDEDLV